MKKFDIDVFVHEFHIGLSFHSCAVIHNSVITARTISFCTIISKTRVEVRHAY